MQNEQINHDTQEVIVSLELAASLSLALTENTSLHEEVHTALKQSIVELLEVLGIPGVPLVQITTNAAVGRSDQWIRLNVNGHLCRYSHELLRRVESYVRARPLSSERNSDHILVWLEELCHEASEKDRETLAEFISIACLGIIKSQPEALLALPQVVAYIACLPAPSDTVPPQPNTWPPDPTWLYPILRKVLRLKISIADTQTVAKVLWTTPEQSPEDISEGLIVALRPDIVELQLPQEYLRQLTMSDPKNNSGLFPFMRDGLFVELGLRYPPLRFVPVNTLKPNSFIFKINSLTMIPVRGLLPEQCLVNDNTSRMASQKIQAVATSNIATGQEGSIIDIDLKSYVESIGLTTWDQMGYFIFCLADDLRKNAVCFIDRLAVQTQLDQLEQAFPDLVGTAQTNISVVQITQVLRALLEEQISIRNLRGILERLLDYAYLLIDPSKNVILDNMFLSYGQPLTETWLKDPVNRISFIRAGMKHYIDDKYARGTQTLVAYILDPRIEHVVLAYKAIEEEEKIRTVEKQNDKILETIRTEIAYLPATAQIPSILTSMDVRPYLREIIKAEFPRMAVLSYQEIPPATKVQPVARLSFDEN
jgi:hypothetical protein